MSQHVEAASCTPTTLLQKSVVIVCTMEFNLDHRQVRARHPLEALRFSNNVVQQAGMESGDRERIHDQNDGETACRWAVLTAWEHVAQTKHILRVPNACHAVLADEG